MVVVALMMMVVVVAMVVVVMVVALDVLAIIAEAVVVKLADFFLRRHFSCCIANMQLSNRNIVVFDQLSFLNDFR